MKVKYVFQWNTLKGGTDVFKDIVNWFEDSLHLMITDELGICNTIRFYHECEGGIEKSVQRISRWQHGACRVMTNGDRERRIFLSQHHMLMLFLNKFLGWQKYAKLPSRQIVYKKKRPDLLSESEKMSICGLRFLPKVRFVNTTRVIQ